MHDAEAHLQTEPRTTSQRSICDGPSVANEDGAKIANTFQPVTFSHQLAAGAESDGNHVGAQASAQQQVLGRESLPLALADRDADPQASEQDWALSETLDQPTCWDAGVPDAEFDGLPPEPRTTFDQDVLTYDLPWKSTAGPPNGAGRLVVYRPEELPEVHPEARFIQASGADEERLRASIIARGQIEPVRVLSDALGRAWLIDGARRAAILSELQRPIVAHVITSLGGKTVKAWVCSKNLTGSLGRNLNDAQKAIAVAQAYAEQFKSTADGRKKAGVKANDDERGEACEQAARAFGLTANRMRDAVKVCACPQLAARVTKGQLNLSLARRVVGHKDLALRSELIALADAGQIRELRQQLARKPQESTLVKWPDALASELVAWDKHLAELRGLCEWAATLRETTSGRLVPADFHEQVQALIAGLRQARPQQPCEYCEPLDAGCAVCHGSAWLSAREAGENRELANEHRRLRAEGVET